MEFQQTQQHFADHLRDPQNISPPKGIEDRRMAIYRDLIYNNIEGFIASGFPVFRSLVADDQWHGLVRDFIKRHESKTPYFLEICQEFLQYLQEERVFEGWEPPFTLELCHYEWVELALDTSRDEIPEAGNDLGHAPLFDRIYQVSPLVWRLSYTYPVHKISESFQPEQPEPAGVFLVVFRNSDDEVRFLEVNQVVINLIQLIENARKPIGEVLLELAGEMQFEDPSAFQGFAEPIVQQLEELSILIPSAQ